MWAFQTIKYSDFIPIGSTKLRSKSHFIHFFSYDYDVNNLFIAITYMTGEMPLKSVDYLKKKNKKNQKKQTSAS